MRGDDRKNAAIVVAFVPKAENKAKCGGIDGFVIGHGKVMYSKGCGQKSKMVVGAQQRMNCCDYLLPASS